MRAGQLQQKPYACDLNNFFEILRGSGYQPVVLHAEKSLLQADVALIPTVKGTDMCILKLQFETLERLSSSAQPKYCFTTPDSFTTGANVPLRSSWMDMQRETFWGGRGASATAMTQEKVLVLASRITAQNSLSSMDLETDAKSLRVQMFATGDPGASTHWLKQIRIAVHAESTDNSKPRSVSAYSRSSVEAVTTVITYHSCDRRSCLGCGTLKLQALCYAAQQCSVVQCVGTVVNQNRPLCNVGLVMKSYMESMLSMTLGAWLIFTESYTRILDAALLGPTSNTNIEWVDDAFFGYICSAKVICMVFLYVRDTSDAGVYVRAPMHCLLCQM